jgi:hypothetical protein
LHYKIIGALCSGWAVVLWLVIPDSPSRTHWFTRRESVIVVSRKRHDQAGTEKRQYVTCNHVWNVCSSACMTQVQWPTSLGDVQRPKILPVLPVGIFRERSQWRDVELVRVFRTALPPDIYVGPVVL